MVGYKQTKHNAANTENILLQWKHCC